MQVGGRRPLARARAGAGVGPAGGAFWHGNVHFRKVFKWNFLPPLGEENLLVLQANLAIRVPVLVVMCRINVNRLIWPAALHEMLHGVLGICRYVVSALPHIVSLNQSCAVWTVICRTTFP